MTDIVERLRNPRGWSDKADMLEAAGEITRLRAATQWRPISTAPKDGTEILVTGGTYDWDSSDLDMNEPLTFVAAASWRNGRWEGENCGGHDEYFSYKPTVWLPKPLPPPPAMNQVGGE